MFKAIQQLDTVGKPLDRIILRDIYAVDRATDSFLIGDFVGQFSWIPSWTCRVYTPDVDDQVLNQQREDLMRECYEAACAYRRG